MGTGCKAQSIITQNNDRFDLIKQLFFSSSALVTVLLTERTVGVPMTGFGSFCQPATAAAGRVGVGVFSGLSPSSLCGKRLLCSTHTVGRPLTGCRFRVSALTHREISHRGRKDDNICMHV